MSTLRWYGRLWVTRLGWPGCIGLAAALAGLALYYGAIQPTKSKTHALEQEAFALRALARANSSFSKGPAGYEAWLEEFYRSLPAKTSAPESLKVIFSAARTQALGLEQGDYKIKVDKNGRLLAYEIGLPVGGTYTQVRKFVAQVLEQIPAIALDEVIIKREGINAARVEASIHFTLFMNAF